MNIFIDERRGTRITQEEREWIEKEVADSKAYLESVRSGDAEQLEKLDKEVDSCKDMGLDAFTRELILYCTEVDIMGMERTLKNGVVTLW